MRKHIKTYIKNTLSIRKLQVSVILALIWFLFIITHILLSGRWWMWNSTSFFHPLLYLLITLSLLGLGIRRKSIVCIAISIVLLPYTILISDVHFPPLRAAVASGQEQQSVTVFTLNTQYWEEGQARASFYQFLKEQDADIYHLQEHYMHESTGETYIPDDIHELQEVFPDYTVIAMGEFVTMSRFPIINSSLRRAFLRCDIQLHGRIVSFYNVHIDIPLHPYLTLQPYRLLEDMRYRFDSRKKAFAELEQEVRTSIYPFFISGDFNTTKAMADIHPLLHLTHDASNTAAYPLPTTWGFGPLTLWKIDYNLVSEEIATISYMHVHASNYSDHKGQKIVFTYMK